MAFDQSTRNRLQKFVNDARNLLSEEFTRQLQATYGLDPKAGSVADIDTLTHLDNRQRQTAHILRDTLAHYLASTHGKGDADRTKQVLSRIVREQAFTVLNRLAALRMAEARGFLLESIGKGDNSKGFQLYKQLAGSAQGETGEAYRSYLYSVFDEFSLDLAVLFDRHSSQGRLFPRESALLELLDLINHHEIEPLWVEDETIGWIYQYFNSQEERKKMRAESQAPRNSRELAVRNQFFTPRYVVEFLTDNTLGRIWYEMTQGNTRLVDICRYLVRRPTEVFLKQGEQAPVNPREQLKEEGELDGKDSLSQEELLKQPVYIPHRAIKDPRCIRMLDPACGSMHFGLYAFDLFERIYEEAWQLEAELGAEAFVREGNLKPLHQTYDSFEDYRAETPRLIVEHNIHGVDIDPRAVQIAGLSLWQRAQRAWQQQGIKPQQRPVVRKSNIVCAEPMPGEKALLQEFASSLNPPVLGQLLDAIFDKMELAGEAGTLLKIEEEIQSSIHAARDQWQARSGTNTVGDMFQSELDDASPKKKLSFDLSGVDDESFWDGAEQLILVALSDYADATESNADQKRLFAEDAAKGFAFIDLCRKRYDAVVMNPPFGETSNATKQLLAKAYANQTQDIYCLFVNRGWDFAPSGYVGAITSNSFLRYTDYSNYRGNLTGDRPIQTLMELGWEVLDDAYVSATAYFLGGSKSPAVFGDCTSIDDKEKHIEYLLTTVASGTTDDPNLFIHELQQFGLLEGSPICYRLNSKFFNFVDSANSVRDLREEHGIGAGPHNIFFRLRWEISPSSAIDNTRWPGLSNGGMFSPFFRDNYLCIDWRGDGQLIKEHLNQIYPYLKGNIGIKIQREHIYFKPGITYGKRTDRFNAQILPSGLIPSFNGIGLYPASTDDCWWLLGYLNCRTVAYFLNLICGLHKNSVYIDRVPIPDFTDEDKEVLEENSKKLFEIIRENSRTVETGNFFTAPILNLNEFPTLSMAFLETRKDTVSLEKQCWSLILSNEATVLRYMNFGSDFQAELDEDQGVLPDWSGDLSSEKIIDLSEIPQKISVRNRPILNIDDQLPATELARTVFNLSLPVEVAERELNLRERIDPKELMQLTGGLVQWFIGIAFGRWDIRIAIGQSNPPVLNAAFDPLPICPPGMLQKDDGLPAAPSDIFGDYPLRITWGGIIVEDDDDLGSEDTSEDIVARVRDVLHAIWGDRASAIEQEACEILNVQALRNYFSEKRSGSAFFKDHLKRYSKSRRQAPIYWPLSTVSGSYTLWLYYPRINRQVLYKCVNDFVENKLRDISNSIEILLNVSNRNSEEESNLARLADLEQEIKDFRDEILRIAKFWKPSLNDGVQITAAPLWKLFQHKAWQKKLKETWESLEKGDYDWAHLACSIWPERVLRKCHQDRSLAIAHDIESTLWHEVEVPVMRGKKATGQNKLEWQPKTLSDAELNALIQARIREMNS